MNVIFEHTALSHLPKFERELKLSHIERNVSELAEEIGQEISVKCSTNQLRTYNIEVTNIDFEHDFCQIEIKSIIE